MQEWKDIVAILEQQYRDQCEIKNLTKINQLIWKGLI